MNSGVSYPSYPGSAFAMINGAAQANFPVQNLADTQSVRTAFQATAAGAIALSFTLSAAVPIQFLGLVHHNAAAADTFRFRLFDSGIPNIVTNAAHIVYDSTALPFYPVGATKSALFPATTPLVLPAPISVISGRLDLSAQAAAWAIGALELGGWWPWPAISVARELGMDNSDVVIEQSGGADHNMSQWASRTVRGDRTEIIVADEQAAVLDFQFAKGLRKPFVFVWDYDDPSTWPRECFLARNATLPKFSKAGHPVAKFAFDLIEHMR